MSTRRAQKHRRSSCAEAVDPGDPLLPVAGQGILSGVRKSKRSRWRAGVLIGVHLLIAIHVTQYLVRGRTLSPVEPSESMYTLEAGQLNAGFILFFVALLSTAIFGRFFCGWGCHLVALQDLCGWMMKKLGIRPRPFRSRLLLWAPLVLALYMFVWPTFKRWLLEHGTFPGWSNHLITDDFWATFPGPVYAVLTFAVCGFLTVYFLGAKGFCTYGCPYGGLFVLAERLSPARIRVTDDCEQCGHCSATCTSNVTVHDEVRRYGMVVDPGCMKCMDCISVCPKNALYYGFGRPRFLAPPPTVAPVSARYALTWPEELGVALVAVLGTLAFRGLYDGPPLLMSVALGALTAFVGLTLWRLARRSQVRLQNLILKSGRALRRGGLVFVVTGSLWMLFAAHSGYVQWQRQWGRYHLDRTEATREQILDGSFRGRTYSEQHHRHASRSEQHFRSADRAGLFGVVEVKLGLAWAHLLRDEKAQAIARVDEALDISPGRAFIHEEKIGLLIADRDLSGSIEASQDKIRSVPTEATDLFRLGGMLVQAGRVDEAVETYRDCIALDPDSGEAHYNLGGLLRRLGTPGQALPVLERATQLLPGDADSHVELGLARSESGDGAGAIEAFERAIELAPDRAESRFHLPQLIEQLRTGETAISRDGPSQD